MPHLYDQRWFIVVRLIVLVGIILYSAPALYFHSRSVLGQSISDRQALELERAAEIRARVRALEESAKEVRSDRINERISALENGMRSTERAVRELADNVAMLNWTGNAILLSALAFVIKEAIRVLKERR